MQQTNASASRTNGPPVMCSSPVRGKKFVPLPAPKLRAPLTPRKSVAVLRKVADQSFNAAKLPVLDMALFEDIPKKIITDCNGLSPENSRREITNNDISTVESDNNDDGNFSGFF
uniref:Uncharacterized protein n=1 Tax=Panagrolaimus superbus TaxID=310955 RepID=A0A914YHJ1_9BILA